MRYIYSLKDPISNEVKYIGCSRNVRARFKQHLKDAIKNRTEKQKWISKLNEMKMLPIIEIIDQDNSPVVAREKEEFYVCKHAKTVLNIHLPGKGSKTVSFFLETGKTK